MSEVFGALVAICLFAIPVTLIIFIIKAVRKKPKKVSGIVLLSLVGGFVLFTAAGILTDPATWCEHQWTVTETKEPTCTERGQEKTYCALCDTERTEKTEQALGHNLIEVSRLDPTTDAEGKITMRCDRCGYEEYTTSDKPTTDTNNADQPEENPGTSNEIQGNISTDQLADLIDDGIIVKLTSFGFTQDEAAEIREIFIKCGITNIDDCSPTDNNATIDGLISYRAEWDKDRVFWFTIDQRQVLYISLNGVDVYDKDKGGFLINVNDIHIPESNVTLLVASELKDLTEKTLDKYFVNSKYYDAFGYARSDNNYMVQCQVYAANALGMKDWIYAKVWYTYTDSGFIVDGVSIDGVQYEVKP